MMVFDSIAKAVQYLKDAWKNLGSAGAILQERINTIDNLIEKAKKTNDQTSIGKLIVARSQTMALQKEREEFLQKLGPFRSYFVSEGKLGVFPVWIIASAGALATALYVFLEKIKTEGRALDLIEKGMLTPTQAQGILGGGVASTLGSAGTLVMWGAIAYGLFIAAPFLKRTFK